MKRLLISAMLALALLGSASGQQSYPTRPIRMLAGFAPGGTTDVMARYLASKMAEKLGQSVVVENKPGAAANIAMAAVAKAAPDGYTLGYAYSSLSINPLVMGSMPFDTMRDLAPVALVGAVRMYLVVDARLPVNSLGDFVALLKQHPGKYALAANALAGPSHLGAELFKSIAGVDVPTIVYKGGAPALVDILAGRVAGMFDTVPNSLPYVKNGKLKALAISGSTRFASLPQVPTYAEAGFPQLAGIRTWNGVVTTAGTPPAVIDKLNATLDEILRSPEVQSRFETEAIDPMIGSPADFVAFIRGEMKTWAPVVKAAKIKLN